VTSLRPRKTKPIKTKSCEAMLAQVYNPREASSMAPQQGTSTQTSYEHGNSSELWFTIQPRNILPFPTPIFTTFHTLSFVFPYL
jgi:hypothetical protein